MTLKEYYLSYKGLLGSLAALVACSPLLALIPVDVNRYIFPPLGIIDLMARVISVLAALAATFVVYFWRLRNVPRAIAILIVAFLVFAVVYGYVAAYNARAERFMIPLLDTLQSIPVLSFLPGVMISMVALFPARQLGIELGSILLILSLIHI